MIRRLKAEEVPAAAAYAWTLCGDLKMRSYPLYSTQAGLLREFEKCAGKDGCVLLGYFKEGRLAGVLSGFAIPRDHYLQTTGLYADSGAVVNALLSEIERGHEALEKYVGVTEQNTAAAGVLAARGYLIADTGREYRVPVRNFHPAGDGSAVIRISRENWRCYAKIHDARFPDIYWTSARLLEDLDHWIALLLPGDVEACLFAKTRGKCGNRDLTEIFGLSAGDNVSALSLLAGLSREMAGDSAVQEVMHLYGGEEWEERVLTDSGFTLRSGYQCWKK